MVQKSYKKFVCACCDYFTSRKSQYSRHLLTAKHLNRVNDSKMIVKKFQEVPNGEGFICGCGKEYRCDSGFSAPLPPCPSTLKSLSTLVAALGQVTQPNWILDLQRPFYRLPGHALFLYDLTLSLLTCPTKGNEDGRGFSSGTKCATIIFGWQSRRASNSGEKAVKTEE